MNIKEVARRAGVSISTVSRVINNTAPVKDDIRAKVEAIIEETGYRPNSLARELQTNRTFLIGVLISVADLNLSSIGPAINAITDVLKAKGYNILLANCHFITEEAIDYLKVFQEKRVDGVLYFSSGLTDKHSLFLKKYPIPVVMIGQESGYLDLPCIVHDDFFAAKMAIEFLIKKGHESIGYIGAPLSDSAAGINRYNGYKVALKNAGILFEEHYVEMGDFTMQSGYLAAQKILKRVKPTALFCATDFMAIGAMHYLKENGIKVPQEISVMGFDDVNVSAFYNPPLTTVHTDNNAIGGLGAKVILDIIEGKIDNIRKFVVGFELLERESVREILK